MIVARKKNFLSGESASDRKSEEIPVGTLASQVNKEQVGKSQIELRTAVKPVSNAIHILRYLGRAPGARSVTQIARALSINPSTCFNILRTLAFEGVIEFNAQAKSYRIGIGLLKLVRNIVVEDAHVAAVRPLMRELAERHNVTLTLWRVITRDREMLVAVESTSTAIRIEVNLGQRIPVLLGASGRAMLQSLGLTKTEARDAFRYLRWARPLNFETYWRQAEEAAGRGWATDDGYYSAGTTSVATPVFDTAGRPAYALVAMMFRSQHGTQRIADIGGDLADLSRCMSHLLF